MNPKNSNNNFAVFVILSGIVLLGFQYFYVKPTQQHFQQVQSATGLPAAPVAAPADVLRDRAVVTKEGARLPITTPQMKGSLNLKGARFDDIQLNGYRESVDDKAPLVTLLSPSGSATPYNAYYAELGWLSDQASMSLPNTDTVWSTKDTHLAPAHPVHLTWKNGSGLSFDREIAVDDQFMFTITDHVTNASGAAVTLYPFGLVARQMDARIAAQGGSRFSVPTGFLGVLNGTLNEVAYKKLRSSGRVADRSLGGWLGVSDQYWLVALVPPQNESMDVDFVYGGNDAANNIDRFQANFRGIPLKLDAGATTEHVTRLFSGAKRAELLNAYGDKFDIPLFNHAIDFGWFWFLTIPFLKLFSHLGTTLGSYGFAILVFTVMLKGFTLPLSLKSNHSMSKMKALQPEIKQLQERFADDKVRQNQEMMELFKREKVSPMSGCVPMLIQIPIFFALYKVLSIDIALRQAPFYGWIKDMSLPDPTSALNLFGLIPYDLPPAFHIGAWPVLMGIGMMVQQKMMPQPTADKSQARMMMALPFVFTYMLARSPAGLVIYWTWSNILGIAQQWYIMRVDAKRQAAK